MSLFAPRSLANLAEQLRQGTLTPSRLVRDCLNRIDEVEQRIRAWISVDREGALATASSLEKLGNPAQNPLWGIPIGIKDIIDVAGWPTSCGADWESPPSAATTDAQIVQKLRAAGAIILGKTVTTMWACFDPPPTRNPWNLERTPGGSSSGSAAAVASGMCVAAIGTQTGGSILRPASFCGIAGLKPLHRPEMLAGVSLVSPTLDHVGPLASSADDLRLIWQGLGMNDVGDGDRSSEESLHETTLVVVEDPFLQHADRQLLASFEQTIQEERTKGPWKWARQTDFPALAWDFASLHRWHRTIMAFEAAQVHRERYRQRPATLGTSARMLVEEGLRLSSAEYDEAMGEREQLRRTIQTSWPVGMVLVMPSTITAAPTYASTGDPRFNSPWSFLGMAAVTIRYTTAEENLPLGLQLISPRERRLLDCAATWGKKKNPSAL